MFLLLLLSITNSCCTESHYAKVKFASYLLNFYFILHCFAFFTSTTWKSIVKTEKKTVQFSEEIQVETIEPEQEPVYIDEVSTQLWAQIH